MIFDDAEKGAGVVPKMGRKKKTTGPRTGPTGVVDCFDRSFEARDGSDGLGWSVCVYGRWKSSEAACSRRGIQVWRMECLEERDSQPGPEQVPEE